MTAAAFLFQRMGGKIKFDRTLCALFIALAVTGAISVIESYDPIKSIGYTVWVLFNFFVIISLCYNFARSEPAEDVLYLWFLIYRIHVVLILLQLGLGIAQHMLVRPYVWFYEASYLSIFMIGYFGAALYLTLERGRRYALDLFLSTIGLLATTTATGILGMALAILFNFIISRHRIKLLLVSAILGALFLGTLWLFFRHTTYYMLIAGFLLNGDVSLAIILERGGNRWIRAIVGWHAFLNHPWTGIGIGGDTAYMNAQPLPEYARQFVRPWLILSGQPFCNIVVEVLGTMGIVGFIPFAAILIYALSRLVQMLRRPVSFDPYAMAFIVAFFSIFLALQLEGTFLRYYLWAPLGLGLGVMARRHLACLPEHPSDKK